VPVHLVTHPVAQHALLRLRDASTPPSQFRQLASRVAVILALEATRDLAASPQTVQTPLEAAGGLSLDNDIAVVPVLRAGLSMVEAVLTLLPDARVGHVGLQRDEETAVASRYYLKLPPITPHTAVLVVDPMLATGGSAETAISLVKAAGAMNVRLLSIVAAPEGVAHLQATCPDVQIYTTAVDRQLNTQKYILPGLGDFGDRLYGT
jgi:uracil phosphoribosyltransferase